MSLFGEGLSEADLHRVHDAVLALTKERHAGQVDKAGAPYIDHVLRVADRLKPCLPLQIIALAHDLIEDTKTTLEELEALGMTEAMVRAVDVLTKKSRKVQTHAQYRQGVFGNLRACVVKLADLDDNMDLARLPEEERAAPRTKERWENYADFKDEIGERLRQPPDMEPADMLVLVRITAPLLHDDCLPKPWANSPNGPTVA